MSWRRESVVGVVAVMALLAEGGPTWSGPRSGFTGHEAVITELSGNARVNGQRVLPGATVPAVASLEAQGKITIRFRGDSRLQIQNLAVTLRASAKRQRVTAATEAGFSVYPRPRVSAAVRRFEETPPRIYIEAPASNAEDLDAAWRQTLFRVSPGAQLSVQILAGDRIGIRATTGNVVVTTSDGRQRLLSGSGGEEEPGGPPAGGSDYVEDTGVAAPVPPRRQPPECPDPVPEEP